MEGAAELFREFRIAHTLDVFSPHLHPDEAASWAAEAAGAGYRVLIAGDGRSAHLPGLVASRTRLPVIGVPFRSALRGGLDALHAMVQMTDGVPVATVGIDAARNAAILACQILALSDEGLAQRLDDLRDTDAGGRREHRDWSADDARSTGFGFRPG